MDFNVKQAMKVVVVLVCAVSIFSTSINYNRKNNRNISKNTNTLFQYVGNGIPNKNIIYLDKDPTNKIAIRSVEFPIGQDSVDITITGKNLIDDSSKQIEGGINGLNEFIKYTDIAPIIDKYGTGDYTLSFDLKSKNTSKSSTMVAYCQNGVYAKYILSYNGSNDGIYFNATTEWKRYNFPIQIKYKNIDQKESILAFYGIYNTGNYPIVKNVQLEYGNTTHNYEEKKSKVITVTKDMEFPIYVDGYGEGTTITNNFDTKMEVSY